MVLGENNHPYHSKSKMGKSFSVDPCAFFDNFNNYCSKESIKNGSASFGISKKQIDSDFIESKIHVKDVDIRNLKPK